MQSATAYQLLVPPKAFDRLEGEGQGPYHFRYMAASDDDLIETIPIIAQNRDPPEKPMVDDARLVYEGYEGASTR